MATKIFKFVQPFTGEGDIMLWLDKLTLVCARLKETPVDVLPLLLEGPAFAVFNEMPEEKKTSGEAIMAVLKEAFGLNGFSAFEQLTTRQWRAGEPVEVFLAALRRLAKLASVESDALLRRAFIVGLPLSVSRGLRTMAKVDTLPLADIVDRARALMAESAVSATAAVSAASTDKRRCFRCNGPHLIRDCTAQGNGSGKIAAPAILPRSQ